MCEEIPPPPEIFCWCKFLNVVPALLADTAVFFLRAFVKKMLSDFQAQNTPKCVCGREPTRENYRAPPDPIAGFHGAALRPGRGKGGEEKEEEEKGRG